jgi:NADH:ubiquinone oxidoreductase subunit F (NADH-binding)
MAGGVVGELKAFSPGGASSGFLPADQIELPMDFKSLRDAGSMLGSAGVVVLNQDVDMVEATLTQMIFFEEESCGQCSPCRIGTQILRQALERHRAGDREALTYVQEVNWGMREASICGLGQAASVPLDTAMQSFPEDFGLGPGENG